MNPSLAPQPDRFEAFAQALHAGGPVEILAIGSASTAEAGTSYVRVMTERLETALPGAALQLDVRGHRGLTAVEMLALLEAALARRRPALVIWQTGTVDAVRGLRPEELEQALEEGASRVAAVHADLILVDPQYSRFLSANTDLAPYEQAMERVAALPGVALFPRAALMRAWTESGNLDIEAAVPAQRPAAVARMHACVGRALAAFVLAGLPGRTASE